MSDNDQLEVSDRELLAEIERERKNISWWRSRIEVRCSTVDAYRLNQRDIENRYKHFNPQTIKELARNATETTARNR